MSDYKTIAESKNFIVLDKYTKESQVCESYQTLVRKQKDNIMVAEYWTCLPSKELLEEKLHNALIEVRERLTESTLIEEEDRHE